MGTRTPTRKGSSGRRRVSTAKKTAPLSAIRQKLVAVRGSVRNTLGRQTDDIWGMILVVLAILVLLAFVDLAGPVGEGMAGGSRFLFGVWRFALPVALAGIGVAMIVGKPRDGAKRLIARHLEDIGAHARGERPRVGGQRRRVLQAL